MPSPRYVRQPPNHRAEVHFPTTTQRSAEKNSMRSSTKKILYLAVALGSFALAAHYIWRFITEGRILISSAGDSWPALRIALWFLLGLIFLMQRFRLKKEPNQALEPSRL
jgi:hypothetical protein